MIKNAQLTIILIEFFYGAVFSLCTQLTLSNLFYVYPQSIFQSILDVQFQKSITFSNKVKELIIYLLFSEFPQLLSPIILTSNKEPRQAKARRVVFG